MQLKRNLLANFIGQAWVGFMGLAFIPIYVEYLGIEAYALVGLFTVFQAWLVLLDLGMTPALSREMTRLMSGHRSIESLRNLLRSVEIISFSLGSLVFLVIAVVAGWVTSSWLNVSNLPQSIVQQALLLMGITLATRLLEGIYKSALVGLQEQTLLNLINVIFATLRWCGSAIILIWVKPDIRYFFLWQGLISVLVVLALSASTYSSLPRSKLRAKFSLHEVQGVWKFASGVLGVSLLGLLLTQVDKILLSKLLPLSEFGYYIFATTATSGLYLMVYPITQAYYPKFCDLSSKKDTESLARSFHQASQLVSVIVGCASFMLIIFSESILVLWTKDVTLAKNTAILFSLTAMGNLLNGLMWIPYQAQLAHAWTSLSTRVNIVAVCLMIPSIIILVPTYGAVSAASLWVGLNCIYLIVAAPLMFRRILKNEKKSWYSQDIVLPLIPALLIIMLSKSVFQSTASDLLQWTQLIVIFVLAITASTLTSKNLRRQIFIHMKFC